MAIIKKTWLSCLLAIFSFYFSCAQPLHQQRAFTKQDTLRGTITPQRAWWDVLHYDITVKPDFNSKTISGRCAIAFRIVTEGNSKVMQIDLQEPMMLDSVVLDKETISDFKREGNVFFISFGKRNFSGKTTRGYLLELFYHGKPTEAVRPPWDGGWIWKRDANNNPWMSVACQGLGASVWYPCKDHQSDEPDNGASLRITVPDSLVAIGNGRLKETKKNDDGTTTYWWQVVNPINNYNIIPYIGKYVNFNEAYQGEKGKLDINYWVLDYNLDKAKEQFRQTIPMLQCFEKWFGPYPFYEDGFKLIESPHLGMEHQSAVAYGNKFQNGYLGRDLSGTGWGLKWDFIIVHESGHEWFANNITSKDLADMWLHEGFTNYSETIFTTCQFGTEAGNDYVIGTRKLIRNDIPIIGPYGVNQEGSGDMYYKGGNLLHTIRQVIDNDTLFRQVLRGLNKTFYHQTVTTRQVENYISANTKKDLSKIFDQYLRTVVIPVFEYKIDGTRLQYRWNNCVKGFNMPVKVNVGTEKWLKPTGTWQQYTLSKPMDSVTVNRNFYVKTAKL